MQARRGAQARERAAFVKGAAISKKSTGARMNLSLHYSERVYNALLSLYPVRFRARFAPEMVQLFRDCCHDALEKGEVAVLAAFWLRAMRDLFLSIIRERQREVLGPRDSEHPLIGF